MRKRALIFMMALFWIQAAFAQTRFIPRWQGRVSLGGSYWKLSDLNQRIENRRPFFAAAGDSTFPLEGLPSLHPSFNLGLQYDLFAKISLLATLEYRQATAGNTMENDSFRVEAATRPSQINLGMDLLWRPGPRENWMLGAGGGISFARFRDDVRVFDRPADTLTGFLLEKYNSTALFGEIRLVYTLPFSLLRDQVFFIEALGRLNPIEAFFGTKNQNGQAVSNTEATFFPPGSSTGRPVKLDFSGVYMGIGTAFQL